MICARNQCGSLVIPPIGETAHEYRGAQARTYVSLKSKAMTKKVQRSGARHPAAWKQHPAPSTGGLPGLAVLLGVSLLAACLRIEAPSTPSPLPPSSTTTPTQPFPTIPPTATFTSIPTATSPPTPAGELGELLFQDDFQVDRGWDLGEFPMGGVTLQGERLIIAVSQPNALLVAPGPTDAIENAYVEVRVRVELCGEGDEYGLAFRFQGIGSHYRFTLTCEGQARVLRVLEGSEAGLIPLTDSPAVIPSVPGENLLSVWAYEGQFDFAINGIQVFSLRDRSLTHGQIGLVVWNRREGQATVSFDDLRLYSLLGPPPTPVSPTSAP